MPFRPQRSSNILDMKRFAVKLGALFALAFIASYLVRPFPIEKSVKISDGIVYERIVRYSYPFKILHVVRIKTKTPLVSFITTPPNIYPGEGIVLKGGEMAEVKAQTTSEFALASKTVVAINGGLFSPFEDNSPFSFAPQNGEGVAIHGHAISNGVEISRPQGGWAVVCIDGENNFSFPQDFECPIGTLNAVPGKYPLILNGELLPSGAGESERAPRTAIAIDRDGEEAILVVIDGRQPLYSDGVTSQEFARELAALGAFNAVELDGGGSSTLVIDRGDGPKLMNSPVHTRIPLRERPVATHFGVRNDTLQVRE